MPKINPADRLAYSGLLALILTYVVLIIPAPAISPEICWAYIEFSSIHSFHQALQTFIDFHEEWYRPLTFHITNYLLFHVIDIHNYKLIKTVSFIVILINIYLATQLAKRIFSSHAIEQIIIFALILSHPLYYEMTSEGSGIVDPFFMIFMTLFMLQFSFLLKRTGRESKTRILLSIIICCILIVATITSQERGLAIFPMAGWLYLNYGTIKDWKALRFNVPASAVILFSIALGVAYIVVIGGARTHIQGVDYRTSFDPVYVVPNLFKGLELPARLLLMKWGKSYDIHTTLEFNLFAVPIDLCLLFYVAHVLRRGDKLEKHNLLIVIGLYLCALPIPIFFGGASWHFYTSAIFLSIITGRAIASYIQKLAPRYQPWALALLFVWLIASLVRGQQAEVGPQSELGHYMAVVPAAQNDALLKYPLVRPQIVYYDTGSFGSFVWPIGAGALFRYLYSDPTIVEIALADGKMSKADQAVCQQSLGKPALYVGIDAQTLHWHTIPDVKCEDMQP